MDFNLTREQEMVRALAREFAREELEPRALDLDKKGEFPLELARRIGELGFMGLIASKEYGGTALGHLARAIVIEEVSKVYAPLGFYLESCGVVVYLLGAFATEDQKREYLPGLCRGDKIAAFALTEASGGSDVTALQASARVVDGGYVLNGRKTFISLAGVADVVVIIARMGESFGAFVVDEGTSGFEITREEAHFGLRGIPMNELALTDCRIPGENLLGREGQGLAIAIAGVSAAGRTGTAAIALGIAGGCYEAALKFSRERKLYGNPIAELQGVQFMLVDSSTEIEAARWLVYKAAGLQDEGRTPRELAIDIARAKLFAGETAVRAAANAIRVMGGYGTTPEYRVVQRFRDAIEILPSCGTQEIMKVTIGRGILG
ncbi:MAG: acyl-CoA dehydrogenase family protein [Chloroflexi bacterium]|nr:acyl-CoA dehydrogenase family protein [Chloroflexota bacterium]